MRGTGKTQTNEWETMLVARLFSTTVLCLVAALAIAGNPQFLTDYAAQQVGMQTQWRSLAPVLFTDGKPLSMKYVVPESGKKELLDLVSKSNRLMSVSYQQLGRTGLPLGKEGAKRLLEFEQLKLKKRGIESSIETSFVPTSRLYLLGTDGSLVAIDGETGDRVWTLRAGNPGVKPLGMDASDKYVAMVSGVHIFVFDTKEGRLLGKEMLEGAPIYGPLIGGERAFIFTPKGGIEGYRMESLLSEPVRERTIPGILAEPTKFPDGRSFFWPVESGYLYCFRTYGDPKAQFRLQPPDRIKTSVSSAPGERFLAVSESGTVYCIGTEVMGKVLWRQMIGESIDTGPMVVNGGAFVVSSQGNLFAFDLETGKLTWKLPGIRQVVGGDGNERIYGVSLANDLLMIRNKTGEVTGGVRLSSDMTCISQNQSDRLLLMGINGALQSLRPTNNERLTPIFELASSAIKKTKLVAPEPETTVEKDPFGLNETPMTESPTPDAFGLGTGSEPSEFPF
jgi:outer membrane protein assembly factor BamB